MPQVRICEMAPRDGLQSLNRERPVPTDKKITLVNALAETGLSFIEVGSFVSKRAVPQMADTIDVAKGINKSDAIDLAALVPNAKYYDEFKQSGLNTVAIFVSASEAYSQFNLRMSIEESMTAATAVATSAKQDGFRLRAHLSAVFQDLDGSDSDLKIAADLTRRLIDLGCDHVAIADTKGTTHPLRVRQVINHLAPVVPLDKLAVHFHDSYGMGVANALMSYECGIRMFDASVGGIGGTPFKDLAKGPGGGGNVVTEELVYMFHQMGVETGIDFDKLMAAANLVCDIANHTGDLTPPSKMLR